MLFYYLIDLFYTLALIFIVFSLGLGFIHLIFVPFLIWADNFLRRLFP